MPSPGHLIVGRIRKAHGIHGEVLVESLTDSPDAVFAPGRRVFAGDHAGALDAAGAILTIAGTRPFKGGFLLGFTEVPDRTAAELWRGRYLLLPVDELPTPEAGEVYLHELVGMSVVFGDGRPVGAVREVYELPHGVVLDIAREDAEGVLIPFQEDVVREVDSAARRITIAPMPGLIE